MNKLLITTVAVTLAATTSLGDAATEAAQKAMPAETGKGEAVAEMVAVQEENPAPAPTAKKVINDYFASKEGWRRGYDAKNDRIMVVESIEFDVKDPKVDHEFVKLRKEKVGELLIKAKAKIIETIMSKMSGSRMLDVPGNPIENQIKDEKAKADKAVAEAKAELAKLDKDVAASLEVLGAQMTAQQTVEAMTAYFTEAEAKNLPASYKAEQKSQYANAKAAYESAKAAYDELAKKADALKGKVTKSMKTSLERMSAMPIYGCTVYQQAESIKPGNGKYIYQIAIVYGWSGEMMRASGSILKGKSVKFKPGKKSIEQWIDGKAKNGALSQWVGPRTYIDNEGNMWFIGIACAPVLDDSDENEKARGSAELEAAAEVVFSLFSDASTKKTLDKLVQTTQGSDGQKETKVYEDFSKTQREDFKDIQIAGNAEMYSNELRHVPSGLDLQVVVCAVNSGNIETLKDVQSRTVALGIEVNTYQEMERGRQDMLKSTYEASKNNAAARAAGAEAAAADLQDKAAKSSGHKAPPAKSVNQFNQSNGKAANGKGHLKTGTGMIVDDDE